MMGLVGVSSMQAFQRIRRITVTATFTLAASLGSTTLLGSPFPRQVNTGKPAPAVTRFKLPNGLAASIIHIVDEPVFQIYTFYPGGLLADEPERTLWTLLAERLSTQTYGLSDGATEADHFRIESWSRPEDWQTTLKNHAQIMKGVPFTEEHLTIFKEDVIVGAYRRQKNRRAQDLALGVYAQACQHGRRQVNITSEIGNAALVDVQAYRDHLWQRLDAARLCVVGSVPADQVEPIVVEHFASIPSRTPPAPTTDTWRVGSLKTSWDYATWYLVLACKVGQPSLAEMAALLVVRDLLNTSWGDQNRSGDRLRADFFPRPPERQLFVMSIAMHSGWAAERNRDKLSNLLQKLEDQPEGFKVLEAVRERLVFDLQMPFVPLLINQVPEEDTIGFSLFGLLGQRRRLWSQLEWYYADQREALGKAVASIKPDEIGRAVGKYLAPDRCTICIIEPRNDWDAWFSAGQQK